MFPSSLYCSISKGYGTGEHNDMDVDGTDRADDEGCQASRSISPGANETRTSSDRPGTTSDSASRSTSDPSRNDSVGIHFPGSPFLLSAPRTQSSISVASLLRQPSPEGTRPYSQEDVPLTQREARLVHYYSEHLGGWLDCTDATRQFTSRVPEKVKRCPVLCHAVLSFAARHRREDDIADAAYQRCIALLVDRLNEPHASHDETLLCAIVILRFYEQLNGRFCILFTGTSTNICSVFYCWFRCCTTSVWFLLDTACFSRRPLCGPFGAYASRSCLLGVCSSVSVHSQYQPATARRRLLTSAASDARLNAGFASIGATETGDCLGEPNDLEHGPCCQLLLRDQSFT
jgi:hypothetical protein